VKNFLEKIKSNNKDEEVTTQKTIVFFAFYVVFFVIVFCVIFLGGKKDYLNQEYEEGNNLYEPGEISQNFVFDYKVNLNGVLHDYYGKRNGDVELFKYNNLDYYRDGDEFLVDKDTWIKTDNPYVYYEFLDINNMALLVQDATNMSNEELDNGDIKINFLISSNTINKALYDKDTDYDEVPDSITFLVDSSGNVKKITYQLDHFCSHRDGCKSLNIEMNFEMFGSVDQIDNPIE